MARVWQAIKKHETEAQTRAEQPSAPEPGPRNPLQQPPPQGPPPEPAREVLPAGEADGRKYSRLLVAHHDRGGQITEQYRSLRTSLLAKRSRDKLCCLITSAEAGEGKTVTALNLALVLTERVDHRTLVADFDLRKGKATSMLAARTAPGVAEVLSGAASVDEAIQPTAYKNLFFVSSGEIHHRKVGELMGRPEVEELVAELRRRFDYVLLDTPPINRVSDAGMLGRAVGEAILVVRMYKTHRESVEKGIGLLHAADVKIGGIVLTNQKYFVPDYLYRYS